MGTHIVTLVGATNCGAFLQAWALGKVLARVCGQPVAYIDAGARSVGKTTIRLSCGWLKRRKPRRVSFYLRYGHAYESAYRMLNIRRLASSYSEDDMLVFGSDEIWNVARTEIASYAALWGEGISGGIRVAYAPSANGADLEAFAGVESLRRELLTFRALSARDASTALSVARLTGRDVPVVCDPTLLLDVDDYRGIQKAPRDDRYLLIYSYGNGMAEGDVADVLAYARERGLRLVSADNWLDWCDECVPCGPLGFLGLIDGAECVVTDTFHGSVFATIYRKRFASYSCQNPKVEDFLDATGLRTLDASRNSVRSVLEGSVEWDAVDWKIAGLRTTSEAFLTDAVVS